MRPDHGRSGGLFPKDPDCWNCSNCPGVACFRTCRADVSADATQLVTQRTAESHAAVDVAGLNYAEQRYVCDGKRVPHRVVLGTETNPRTIDRIWALVKELPYVTGDFTWTGWDYLGEVGLGRTDYTDDLEVRGGGDPAYPWLLAWCGDIDITASPAPGLVIRRDRVRSAA